MATARPYFARVFDFEFRVTSTRKQLPGTLGNLGYKNLAL
jgi:hypothetical protein